MEKMTVDTVRKAAKAIYDKKGINILAIDVSDVSTVTDYLLIAEGTIERHVQALAREVVAVLKEEGIPVYKEDGMNEGDWIALDYVNFMVHILTSEQRNFYQLERIWKDAKLVDLELPS